MWTGSSPFLCHRNLQSSGKRPPVNRATRYARQPHTAPSQTPKVAPTKRVNTAENDNTYIRPPMASADPPLRYATRRGSRWILAGVVSGYLRAGERG